MYCKMMFTNLMAEMSFWTTSGTPGVIGKTNNVPGMIDVYSRSNITPPSRM